MENFRSITLRRVYDHKSDFLIKFLFNNSLIFNFNKKYIPESKDSGIILFSLSFLLFYSLPCNRRSLHSCIRKMTCLFFCLLSTLSLPRRQLTHRLLLPKFQLIAYFLFLFSAFFVVKFY